MKTINIGNRVICIAGVAKLFYEGGFPISMSVKELSKEGVEVSFLHLVNELWNNNWSWKAIESKLKGELSDDIDKALDIDLEYLKTFYNCLEQPFRSKGGYEKSREMLNEYLFTSKEHSIDFVRNNYVNDKG